MCWRAQQAFFADPIADTVVSIRIHCRGPRHAQHMEPDGEAPGLLTRQEQERIVKGKSEGQSTQNRRRAD